MKEETEEGKGGERRGTKRKTIETNIEERIGGRQKKILEARRTK